MVVNPDELISELAEISSKGVDTSNMFVSSRAVILMPYHIELDNLGEKSGASIGTTKRGIGYAYADRARRTALRFEDLLDLEHCKKRIEKILPTVNSELKGKGGRSYEVEEIFEKCKHWAKFFKHMVVDPVSFLNKAIDSGEKILFE